MKKRSRPAKGGYLPTTRKVSDILQARYALAHGETLVESVGLSDGNASTVRAGEALDLNASDLAKNILFPVDGIQKRDFSLVTL